MFKTISSGETRDRSNRVSCGEQKVMNAEGLGKESEPFFGQLAISHISNRAIGRKEGRWGNQQGN